MARFVAIRALTYVILAFLATSFAYLLAAALMNPQEVLYPPIATEPVPYQTAQMYLDVRNVNPDTPLMERYANWLGGLVRGDLGVTTGTNKSMVPVTTELANRIPISLRLVVLGTIIGTVAGVLLGMIAAVARDSIGDRLTTLLAFFILSLPTPVIILIVQQTNQGIMDVTGWGLPAINPINPLLTPGSWASIEYQIKALVMPTIVLSLSAAASYSRYMKVTTLDVLGSDYLRTARAKGLTRGQAMNRHGLRMALIPMGQYFAFAVGAAFTGSLFVELMFNWQGVGRFAVSAIGMADVNGTAGVVLYTAVLTLLSATFADILQGALDPRIR
ncbi:ABC transporter permease [Brachybacterium muris]|uniref:Peptide ABC transporter permease n=1 Tax=Brachybacterium muris UCD-AY4 TaxID=1249481 RepID=A0A022KX40_9MICO|nr:ABC transporter permease [Brachybacterium muris]EYT50764.1 peptide ABC transporter permease [Brachybacterium muris UCD-AY4]MBM7499678.1 peptide/nickel transport system permease protein [Brachybacterium muris]MCT1654396.1 ABC transporter permease [Brachybacterium muris]MCT1998060.1 ABC transporter permease [Brachybacterium muris]MCT2176171.1 ABC transporter permease [Brachybacterium muris]